MQREARGQICRKLRSDTPGGRFFVHILRNIFFTRLGILAAFASSLAAGTLVPPIGLLPGDHYRLVFVTEGSRDATSYNIADYDSFVNTEANAIGSLLQPFATQWIAIGSTPSISASTHIALSDSVPLFLVSGNKVADGLSAIWTAPLLAPVDITQYGDMELNYVWTGTDPSGGPSSLPLGSQYVSCGWSYRSDSGWVKFDDSNSSYNYAFYGISATDLVVAGDSVPEPATFSVMLLGALGLVGAGRYRRNRTR
jgi:hypothetical protein